MTYHALIAFVFVCSCALCTYKFHIYNPMGFFLAAHAPLTVYISVKSHNFGRKTLNFLVDVLQKFL